MNFIKDLDNLINTNTVNQINTHANEDFIKENKTIHGGGA